MNPASSITVDNAPASSNGTSIDTVLLFDLLRRVGMRLQQTFKSLPPLVEHDEMIAAFRTIDGEAGAAIKAGLADAYPGIHWLEGELGGGATWQCAHTGSYWICDAIDGAVQYLRSIPQWCISLTLIHDGKPVFSAILDVMHDELFHAVSGAGAFLNGKRIHANTRSTLKGALVATSQPPFINSDAEVGGLAGRSLSAVLADVGAVRNLGPTSLQLAYVACGRLDAFWEFGEDTFNCLAGVLLIQEAGGVVTDVGGHDYRMQASSLIAASRAVHTSLIAKLTAI